MTTTIQRLNEAEKLKDQGKLEEATALLTGILADDESHIHTTDVDPRPVKRKVKGGFIHGELCR